MPLRLRMDSRSIRDRIPAGRKVWSVIQESSVSTQACYSGDKAHEAGSYPLTSSTSAEFKNAALSPLPTRIHEKHRDNLIFALFVMYPMIPRILITPKPSRMPGLHNPNTV